MRAASQGEATTQIKTKVIMRKKRMMMMMMVTMMKMKASCGMIIKDESCLPG